MISRGRLSLLLLLASLALAASASAATPLSGPTPVRWWNGTAVLSLRDASSPAYRLAIAEHGGVPQPIPGIAPQQQQPFDADIGPGPDGKSIIVYARCPPLRPSGRPSGPCHLFRTTPSGGSERPIAGATSPEGSETAPTIWRTRLAFARRYAKGSERVYVRPLNASARTASTRLPGVPRRFCEFESGCHRVADGTIAELQLRGLQLAQIANFGLHDSGICGERQVRLVDIQSRHDTLVGDTVCGLSGQTWLGLSWVGSRLLFARTCQGDPGGCSGSSTQAYRYTPRTRATETFPQHVVVLGFAATDLTHALEVQAPEGPTGRCNNYIPGPAPPCQLATAGPFAFSSR